MSDPKRVTLTTVSSSLMTAGSSRFGAEFLAPSDKLSTAPTSGSKNGTKSLRLKVELFQTDSNKYPEFNYAKLMHLEKKKMKKLKQKSNGYSADPFEENDDDVARIAKELERKYGSAYGSGRGKSKRDDIDIGLGYDESDSFIDNTEAYDELIPDEVETIEGGFYINCGALEFKKLHTESMTTKTDEIIKMPDRPKKRVISSSSEESSSSDSEESDDSEDDDEDDDDSAEEASVETTKSKSSSSIPADKKSKSTPSTTNPAKKKSTVGASENGGAAKKRKVKNGTGILSTGSSSNSPKPPTDDLASDTEREKNAKKMEKTTTVKDMLKAQRDNYLKSQTTSDVKSSNGRVKGKSSGDDNGESESSDGSDDDDDEDESDNNNSDSNQSAAKQPKDKKSASSTEETQGNEKLRSSDTKLPELEADVLTSVVEFRDGVKSRNLVGKKFQFDDQLSENFLKIDDSLLCIDKAERSMVYAHLEFQLSLPRYFFFRKAKQLREKEEKLKSTKAFNKLHKAVTETMPAVIASYDAELRRYAELQAAQVNSDQPPKMPKKKFPWNSNLRNLLYDVYQVRWTSYPVLGKKKDTLEDFITTYMSKKVVEIWPKGWMRYEELQKEIEKRKTAAKKAKEKAKPATVTTQPSVNSTMGSQNPIQESAARSNANSDTDSVASSSASSGLKRKNADTATGSKQSKSKAAKLNGEQQKNSNLKSLSVGMDLTSPNKKTDHSINHIISPTSAAAAAASAVASSIAPTAASSIFSATVAALSQPLKHSNNTHIIDLDNYTSSNDIMQQAAAANAAALASFSMSNAASLSTAGCASSSRRESSGDSEIEIVGVFPAKVTNKKQTKTNSRSGTPNSNHPGSEKTYNNNNNRNTKKTTNATVTSGALSMLGVEGYNKMVNSFLMDMGDQLQVKPILSPAASQKSAQSSSSSVPSNMTHQ